MRKIAAIISLAALAATAPAIAQEAAKPEFLSPNEIVDKAAPKEWRAIAASDLLVMDLAPDAAGKERRVIIQLMPEPFSQGWIRNIRKLAKANWWDGTSINRVQDNYVVQWGDPAETEETRKPLPKELEVMTAPLYELRSRIGSMHGQGVVLTNSLETDNYGDVAGFYSGFPFARSADQEQTTHQKLWPVHCYGAIGVGRGYSPDTGSGAELYTVIGHAPRHLDRNIAVVGRIVEGIEHLSSLSRGTGPLGFYETAEERVSIQSIRIASDLAETDQPRFEYLDTEGDTFAQYADARANRRDPFFIKPAGGADICNIPVPVRRVKGE